MKFLKILKVAGAIMTFGASVPVLLERCTCGNNNVRPQRERKSEGGRWFVYCYLNRCRRRTASYRFKRTAMRAWNRDIQEARSE